MPPGNADAGRSVRVFFRFDALPEEVEEVKACNDCLGRFAVFQVLRMSRERGRSAYVRGHEAATERKKSRHAATNDSQVRGWLASLDGGKDVYMWFDSWV